MSTDPEPYEDGSVYDEARYISKGGQLIARREAENFEHLLKEMGLEEGDTVAEVGAGTGMKLDYFQDYHRIALDISDGMLEESRANNRADEHIQADALNLPLENDSVDYVFSSRVMHLLDDKDLLHGMAGIAREGMAFDYFRKGSTRSLYNDFMGWFDSRMPDNSSLHADDEIDSMLEEIDSEQTVEMTDFAVPFGVYRETDFRALARTIDSLQQRLSENDLGNTVGYRALKLD